MSPRGLPFPIEIHYQWDEHGRRFVIRKLVCESDEDPGITGWHLRQIPVDRIIARHLNLKGGGRGVPTWDGHVQEDELQAVAMIYKAAYANRMSPVVEVARQFQLSRSTANKKVIAARKAGYLPKTTQGKAGA